MTRRKISVAALVHRLRAVSPEQWFLVGFVLLLVVFLVVLFLQPRSVGGGGK